MRAITIPALAAILALSSLTGCLSLHADVPPEAVHYLARKDGIEMGAICSHDGQTYSEGAIVCMADRAMTCDPEGRWLAIEGC